MGIKAKQWLINILRDNADLIKKVKCISSAWHDSKKGYPQVTITQISNNSGSYSDDKIDFRIPLFQVDIWSKSNPFSIAEDIITILDAEGYEPTDEREQNEADINRVILTYRLIE